MTAPDPAEPADRRTTRRGWRRGDTDRWSSSRRLAIGGIIGPVAFVGAWGIGALVNDRELSIVHDAISQLAHVDSNTRWLMTAGFVTFGVGVGAAAVGLRDAIGRAAAFALAVAAASTLAVAALPLGVSEPVDRLHGIAAGIGYVALAAAPLAAGGPLRRHGARFLAASGGVVAAVSAMSLGATLTGASTGAFQRVGLTVVDVWIVVVSARFAAGRIPEPCEQHSKRRSRDGR